MRRIVIIIAGFVSNMAFAQDHHFSQFYFTHFSVNPAYAGKIQEDFRFMAIHRSQWFSIGSQFNTTGGAFDMNFKGGKLKDNVLGVGVSFVNDNLIKGLMKEQDLALALAWHRPLDGLNRSVISFGMQGALGVKSVSGPEAFLWGSEFDHFNRPVDTDGDGGEGFQAGSFTNFKFNAGASWSYEISQNLKSNIGIAAYNMNKPQQTFFSATSSDTTRVNWREVFNVGFVYKFNEIYSLHPSILWQQQAGARNVIYGAFLGFSPQGMKDRNMLLLVGPWFRGSLSKNTQDAVVLATAFQFSNYRIGLSYDFTASGLNRVKDVPLYSDTRSIGAFEISLTYLGLLNRANPGDYTIPCRFF